MMGFFGGIAQKFGWSPALKRNSEFQGVAKHGKHNGRTVGASGGHRSKLARRYQRQIDANKKHAHWFRKDRYEAWVRNQEKRDRLAAARREWLANQPIPTGTRLSNIIPEPKNIPTT